MNILDSLDAASLRSDIPTFRSGDELKVHVRVIEGSKSRIQVFQGLVISRSGSGVRETFTIRKVSYGVGVERTFPIHTPVIEKMEVVRRGDVRRAKLYYLRELRGKAANSTEWETLNNLHPLQINLDDYYATFGGGAKVNGTLSVTGDVIAYSTSDKNLKNNIKNIDEPLNKLQKINGVTFDWDTSKQEIYSGSDIGVIAQEIEQVLPDAVCTREDGYKAVKYEKIVPLLIESVKELTALVETLQAKIANLEN